MLVFMFGMTLCELFTHDEPFGSNVDVTQEEMADGKQPDKPSVELCPDAVWDVIKHCLAKEPQHRPTMDRVLFDLTQLLEVEQKQYDELLQRKAEDKKKRAGDSEAEQNRWKTQAQSLVEENKSLKAELETKNADNSQLQAAVDAKSRESKQLIDVTNKQLDEARLEIQQLQDEIKRLHQPQAPPAPPSLRPKSPVPVDMVCSIYCSFYSFKPMNSYFYFCHYSVEKQGQVHRET